MTRFIFLVLIFFCGFVNAKEVKNKSRNPASVSSYIFDFINGDVETEGDWKDEPMSVEKLYTSYILKGLGEIVDANGGLNSKASKRTKVLAHPKQCERELNGQNVGDISIRYLYLLTFRNADKLFEPGGYNYRINKKINAVMLYPDNWMVIGEKKLKFIC